MTQMLYKSLHQTRAAHHSMTELLQVFLYLCRNARKSWLRNYHVHHFAAKEQHNIFGSHSIIIITLVHLFQILLRWCLDEEYNTCIRSLQLPWNNNRASPAVVHDSLHDSRLGGVRRGGPAALASGQEDSRREMSRLSLQFFSPFQVKSSSFLT